MKYIDDLRNSIDNLLSNDNNIFLIGEDICDPYGGAFKVTKGLSKKHPQQLYNTPMSEQSIVGMSIGMAINGLKPIVEIMFGDFITLAADQVINHLTKFYEMYDQKMHFVLRTPNGGYRGYGATHSQSLEKIFLGIPGLTIVCPSVLSSPGPLLAEAIHAGKPILFIENKIDYAKELIPTGLYKDVIEIIEVDEKKHIYKSKIVDEMPDVSVLTYGGMVERLLTLQEQLFLEEEIAIEVISLSQINKIDYDQLSSLVESRNIVTVEEGVADFGWGQTVLLELLKRKKYDSMKNFGAKKSYIPVAKNLEDYILPAQSEIIDYLKMVSE